MRGQLDRLGEPTPHWMKAETNVFRWGDGPGPHDLETASAMPESRSTYSGEESGIGSIVDDYSDYGGFFMRPRETTAAAIVDIRHDLEKIGVGGHSSSRRDI
ncbi:hypothetical protein PInf_016361 [Phytophthora infestans]|nr:hypothetical protein PInf_016361 [Phytophthora infestans]